MWGIASTLVLIAFVWSRPEHPRFTMGAAIAFLLFPIAVTAGFAVAWRRELLGGLIAVGSFALFNIFVVVCGGRWPLNGYFLALVAPGFLHLANALFVSRGANDRSA